MGFLLWDYLSCLNTNVPLKRVYCKYSKCPTPRLGIILDVPLKENDSQVACNTTVCRCLLGFEHLVETPFPPDHVKPVHLRTVYNTYNKELSYVCTYVVVVKYK